MKLELLGIEFCKPSTHRTALVVIESLQAGSSHLREILDM